MALGQSAGPHVPFIGIDNRHYLNCPKAGVTLLPRGKEETHCPRCPYRLVPLENLIKTDGLIPEYTIMEETY